ncbi:MAG: hypothetical protein JNK31_05305 [Candidatus Competibacter sp.]|nr:hypothetical protein [Candidatus Competibacter sp.]
MKELAAGPRPSALLDGLTAKDTKEKLATHPELAGIHLTRDVSDFNGWRATPARTKT